MYIDLCVVKAGQSLLRHRVQSVEEPLSAQALRRLPGPSLRAQLLLQAAPSGETPPSSVITSPQPVHFPRLRQVVHAARARRPSLGASAVRRRFRTVPGCPLRPSSMLPTILRST